MRCQTLAQSFEHEGHKCFFVCKEYPEQLHRMVNPRFETTVISSDFGQIDDAMACIEICKKNDVSLVVVDNYGLDRQWESQLKNTAPILCIDDLANRPHNCRILIDSNFYHNATTRYQGLVPSDCKQLLGPQYAIIRDEFYNSKKVSIPESSQVLQVFCFFGGTDPTGETLRLLEALNSTSPTEGLHFQIVFTKANSRYSAISSFSNSDLYSLQESPISIATLMSKCQLYLGSGGTITWERMCLGLSGIVISVADNQAQSAADLAVAGFHIYAGKAQEIQYGEIIKELHQLASNRDSIKITSSMCQSVVGKIKATEILNILGE